MAIETALAVGGGLQSHPESNRQCMTIDVDRPYPFGGSMTRLWAEPSCPEPVTGEQVAWDSRHVELRGQRWAKVEMDSDPDAELA